MTNTLHKTKIIQMLIMVCVCVVLFGAPLLAQGTSDSVKAEVDDFAKIAERDVQPSKGLEGMIYSFSVSIGGAALWIGGNLLDYSVEHLVVGMGAKLKGGLGSQVDLMWIFVRDFFNILFIFGLIWIGLRTILFSEDSSTKKMLGYLIIAALMINFSLFITKAVVDVTNVASLQLFNAISGEAQLESHGLEVSKIPTNLRTSETSISNRFMDQFLFTTFAQTELLKTSSEEPPSFLTGRFSVFGLLMMVVMLIAGFVFAAGAFLMISRFVALIIFMVLSPAMFLGFVFPLFKQYQDLWWKMFLKYAFVAPAYLFMLYLSLQVIEGMGNKNGSFNKGFSAESFADGSFGIFLNFFVIAALLVASLKVASSMGVYGATGALGMLKTTGNYIRGGAGATTFGLAAKGLQSTAGGRSRAKLSDETWVEKNSETFLGRRKIAAAQKMASASFDARNIGGVGKKLGIGESKGSWDNSVKTQEKKHQDMATLLGTVDDDDTVVKRYQTQADSAKEKIEELKAEKAKTESPGEKAIIQKQIKSTQTELREAERNVKMEKDRRVTGSAAENNALSGAKDKLTQAEKDLKAKMKTLKDLPAKTRNEQSKAAREAFKAATIEVSKQENNIGGYLNERARNEVFPSGRSAAKKVRAAHEKKRKKTGDQINTDRIIDELDKTKAA